jgi:hypothetical protein
MIPAWKWSRGRKCSPNDPRSGNGPYIVPQMIPVPEVVTLHQRMEMYGFRNLDSEFKIYIIHFFRICAETYTKMYSIYLGVPSCLQIWEYSEHPVLE